jgi:hypothetical protein
MNDSHLQTKILNKKHWKDSAIPIDSPIFSGNPFPNPSLIKGEPG